MQGREDAPGFIRAFAGENRYIVDYLVEEVLQRQPEQVRSFLLQTSILDRLSGPLCDAVRMYERSLRLATKQGKPGLYEIRIKGHLADRWAGWFAGLTITLEENGDTVLTGPVIDQAALFGSLRKVRDLGMPLLSVKCVNPSQAEKPKLFDLKAQQRVGVLERVTHT